MTKGNFFCKFLDHHVNHGKSNNAVLNSPEIKHTEGEKRKISHPGKAIYVLESLVKCKIIIF